jgi:membrane protease YdiL (CAAX protease family)
MGLKMKDIDAAYMARNPGRCSVKPGSTECAKLYARIVILSMAMAFTAPYAIASEKGATNEIPLFYLLAPGGTHIYEGDMKEGIQFAASELTLLSTGILINERMGRYEKRELNVPLLMSGQLYIMDKWRYFQKTQIRLNEQDHGIEPSIKFDPSPPTELMLAPFKRDVVFTPMVLAFAALGVLDGVVGYDSGEKKFSDISSVTAFNNRMNRDAGTLYYESSAFAVSWGAAVSEEMLFRGLLLPVLDYKYGKRKGLAASSVTFGLLHLANPDVEKPEYLVAQATLAGFIFGYNVQRNDYRLSQAIAAHFWYNFVSMTTTWFTNPKENPLGVGVAFGF